MGMNVTTTKIDVPLVKVPRILSYSGSILFDNSWLVSSMLDKYVEHVLGGPHLYLPEVGPMLLAMRRTHVVRKGNFGGWTRAYCFCCWGSFTCGKSMISQIPYTWTPDPSISNRTQVKPDTPTLLGILPLTHLPCPPLGKGGGGGGHSAGRRSRWGLPGRCLASGRAVVSIRSVFDKTLGDLNFQNALEVNISNDSGIWDPRLEIMRIEIMRTDRSWHLRSFLAACRKDIFVFLPPAARMPKLASPSPLAGTDRAESATLSDRLAASRNYWHHWGRGLSVWPLW